MISMTCPHCGQTLSIDEKHAGQTGQCRNCGKPITVPKAVTPMLTPAEEAFVGFSVMDEDHSQPKPQETRNKPKVNFGKKEERSSVFSGLVPWLLAGVLLIAGGVVVVKLVGASLDATVREPETTGKGVIENDSVLPGKTVEDVVGDMTKTHPKVAWMEVDGDNVYLAWKFNPGDLKSVAARKLARNASILGSEANQKIVTTYLLDSATAQKGWKPEGAGLVYKAVALQGEIEASKCQDYQK